MPDQESHGHHHLPNEGHGESVPVAASPQELRRLAGEEDVDHGHDDHGCLEKREEIEHAGHRISVLTCYQIEIDGRPVKTHMSILEDGKIFTHALPYYTFATPLELAKALAERYGKDF